MRKGRINRSWRRVEWRKRQPIPDTALLAPLSGPSTLIFGPTKAGKTRTIFWDAVATAKALDTSAMFIITESNIEDDDIRQLLTICAHQEVNCIVFRPYAARALNSINTFIRYAYTLPSPPRVIAIDSLTSLIELVISENVDVDTETLAVIARQSAPYSVFLDPIRRHIARVAGYMYSTAQATTLINAEYGSINKVRFKPRFAGLSGYKDDAEVYVEAATGSCRRTHYNRVAKLVHSRRSVNVTEVFFTFEEVQVDGINVSHIHVEDDVAEMILSGTSLDEELIKRLGLYPEDLSVETFAGAYLKPVRVCVGTS